jgi:hypothetical protein
LLVFSLNNKSQLFSSADSVPSPLRNAFCINKRMKNGKNQDNILG